MNDVVKFMFSKKATKIDKIFTVNLTVPSKCQIYGEDFVKFCSLLRKHKIYLQAEISMIWHFFLNQPPQGRLWPKIYNYGAIGIS